MKHDVQIETTAVDSAPRPPLVSGAPVVGNALDMARDPADFFVRMYQEYGTAFRIQILNKRYTVLAGPKANIFMSRYGKTLLRSKEFWQGMVDEFGATKLLVSEDGETHASLRKVMKRGFARSALDGRYQELIDLTRKMIAQQWQPGTKVPVVKSMQRLVTEQLGQIMANRSPGAYVEDIRLFIKRILNVRVTHQRPGFLLHLPDYKRARSRVREMGQEIIDQHQPDSQRPTLFLDDLLAASAADKSLIPDSDLVWEVLSPYIAGLDTVANTTSAYLYAVLKHPELMRRLTAEVDAVFAAGTPTRKTLRTGMPVTYGAFMETLRMYPIAVAAMRNATQDFLFEGFRIREGEPLYMATAVSHFLPEFYPEPYRFDVDRFHKPRYENRQTGAFAAFGLGPHTCLGAGLAEVLVMLTMATLFHQLELELTPRDYELKLHVAPTPGPEMNFQINVVRKRELEPTDSGKEIVG